MVQVGPLLLSSASVMDLISAAPAARKAVAFGALALSLCWSWSATAQTGGTSRRLEAQEFKLDRELTSRAALGAAWRQTRIIVQLNGKSLPPELKLYQRARLDLIDAY